MRQRIVMSAQSRHAASLAADTPTRQPSPMTRRFTVEDANRTLPLVSRIVRDILEHYREWHQTVEAFEVANVQSRPGRPLPEAEALQLRAQSLAQDIQTFLGELAELGVEFKGFEKGLVDFPGEIDGRPINLCWSYGETAVHFWHEVDAGYDARRPIEVLRLTPVNR
jgi:hypothetical protein